MLKCVSRRVNELSEMRPKNKHVPASGSAARAQSTTEKHAAVAYNFQRFKRTTSKCSKSTLPRMESIARMEIPDDLSQQTVGPQMKSSTNERVLFKAQSQRACIVTAYRVLTKKVTDERVSQHYALGEQGTQTI